MTVVEEQQRLTGREDENQVLCSIVVDISKQGHGCGIQDIHSSLLADIFKSAVAQIPEKPVGQAALITARVFRGAAALLRSGRSGPD